MKTATFENSVNVLVKAYFDGYLDAWDSCCCAVGNLIAGAMEINFSTTGKWVGGVYPKWQETLSELGEVHLNGYCGESKKQIDSTGYTPEQLSEIEKTFCDHAVGEDENFNGLMAVVDVLADIHKISFEQKSVAKAMFVKETTL